MLYINIFIYLLTKLYYMAKNLVGPPVTGEDFIGRKNEIERAISILEQGNSILLASPRRVGKSSFSQKMLDVFSQMGYKSIYLDLQGVKDEQEFGDRLAYELRKIQAQESIISNIKGKIEGIFGKVKKIDFKGVGVEFKENSDKFYEKVESLLSVDEKYLIVVDELAIFLQALESSYGIEHVESFMNWFRKIRISKHKNIVWILCSSISITNYVSKNKISHTINDVVSLNLGEMTSNEATELLLELCDGISIKRFSESEVSYILTKLGWKLPFFIQMFFQYYQAGIKSKDYEELSIENIVDIIIDKIIKEHQISSWSERLAGYGKYTKSAQLLLNYLCQPGHKSVRSHLETIVSSACPKGDDTAMVYAEVRQMLENDGYIMETESGDLVFRSPIIRQYWFSKFVK